MMRKIDSLKTLVLVGVILISFSLVQAANSGSYPVTATYCDGSKTEIYPFSFVTQGDGTTFNCYEVTATPIQDGYRYGFEDSTDYDYNDVVIELWVTGNNTGSPIAHVKYVSKEATYKHWVYVVYNGMQQMVFRAEEAAPGAVFDIPLPVKQCGDFEIKANPPQRTIDAGDSTHYTVTIKAMDGFTADVDLIVSGLPTGASGSFNPNPLPITGESKLEITTTTEVAAGTYILTITGTAGEKTHSTQVTLVIKAKPQPDFSIAAVPADREIFPGDSTTYTVTVTGINDFDSPVNLTVSGLPVGVDGAFGVNPVTPSPTGESTLNITTSAAAAVGTYTLTISGEGGGKNHTASVTLKINERPPEPDFSLNAAPPQRTINQGDSTFYTVTVKAVNGFKADVNLSVSGLPTGASGAFNPNPLPITGESKLEIITTTDVAVGIYTLTITGTAGEKVHATQVILEIRTKPLEPNFSLEANPEAQSLFPGESTEFILKLTSLNGFSDPVKLYIDQLPEGVTYDFQPGMVKPTGESKLIITAANTTPVGTYSFLVAARGGGIKHTVKISLTVKAMPLEPDFEIKVEPAVQTLYPGDSTAYTVTLTSLNSFSAAVALEVSGVPAGTTATFKDAAVTPTGQTQLRVITTTETPIGDHSLTITGKGGEKEHSVSVKLSVICRDFTIKINAEPTKGPAPLAVDFGSVVTRDGLELSAADFRLTWDFGDGTASDQPNPQHTFTEPGNYAVKLTATDPCGKTKSASVTINVEGFSGGITKTFSPTQALPSQEVSILLEARNNTSYDFPNVTIRDTLSPYLEYVADDASVKPRRSGQELEWQIPSLKKGETLRMNIKVKVSEQAPQGTIDNAATLAHDSLGPGQRLTSNTAVLTIKTVEIILQKTVEQTTAKPGDTIKYHLTVKNQSDIPLTGIKLTDELSTDLEFVNRTGDLEFGIQGRELQWTGTIGAHRQADIVINARVKTNVFTGTRIRNRARMEAAEMKAPLESNEVETTVSAEPIPTTQVRFTKHSEVPQTEVGRIIRFSITAANQSNSYLLSPVIEDNLPQGFSYVASTTLLNNQLYQEPQGNRRLQWQLPSIPPGETQVLRFQVVIGADAKRGKNVNHAFLRTTDNSGQQIFLEASAFVNVSSDSFIFYCGVEGTVYLDRDDDNFYTMADKPLQGIEVRLSTGEKAITDTMGHYNFETLYPGEYAVGVNTAALPERYKVEPPNPKVVVLADGLTDTADFAVKFQADDEVKTARLEGRVFFDKNQNLAYDPDDALCEVFKANLDNQVLTNGSNGSFVFTHLEPGAHTLEITYNDGTKKITKEITLNKGNNPVDIPLPFTGIKIIITSKE